jgi:hypothetical protein
MSTTRLMASSIATPEVSGDRTEHDADGRRHADDDEADDRARCGAPDKDAGEDVAAQLVQPEPVRARWPRESKRKLLRRRDRTARPTVRKTAATTVTKTITAPRLAIRRGPIPRRPKTNSKNELGVGRCGSLGVIHSESWIEHAVHQIGQQVHPT